MRTTRTRTHVARSLAIALVWIVGFVGPALARESRFRQAIDEPPSPIEELTDQIAEEVDPQASAEYEPAPEPKPRRKPADGHSPWVSIGDKSCDHNSCGHKSCGQESCDVNSCDKNACGCSSCERKPCGCDACGDSLCSGELCCGAHHAKHRAPCRDGKCGHCDRCCGLPVPDYVPRFGLYGFSGAASWRGVADGTFQNNNGFVQGLNAGAPLPGWNPLGLAGQVGASYGFYDLVGRTSNFERSSQIQSQAFITAGLYRRATPNVPFSIGVVHDWMLNQNFGVFAQSPWLSQWRGQVGWAVSDRSELGVWAAVNDRGATKYIEGEPAQYQALAQLNGFWHRNWAFGGDTWIWAGVPEQNRLALPGSLGDFTIGGSGTVPLGDRFALYGNFMYMKPSAQAGPAASAEYSYNVTFGIAFYPGGYARNRTVSGRAWMPLLPVADNGNFLVDAAPTF